MQLIEKTTKFVGMFTAVFAVIGGGYAAFDKIGNSFKNNAILKWAPEYFEISDGPVDGEFKVIVARQKLRNDCSVQDFKLEVRDTNLIVHIAKPSISKFSGSASNNIEKFGYFFTIENPKAVSKGRATLLAHIYYKCPEGEVVVNYPDHINMTFNID